MADDTKKCETLVPLPSPKITTRPCDALPGRTLPHRPSVSSTPQGHRDTGGRCRTGPVGSRNLKTNKEEYLWDFAEVKEPAKELFRFRCGLDEQPDEFMIILYAGKMMPNAVIDPRDEAFWQGLYNVARFGVNDRNISCARQP
ncbi:hypothetical protein GGR53DRAFT_471718 [Hypoxylon sp. FL1150]|nr:hypothetical protein GGR53DRAFT_471718 [Hypoxylon sp. FL1150]